MNCLPKNGFSIHQETLEFTAKQVSRFHSIPLDSRIDPKGPLVFLGYLLLCHPSDAEFGFYSLHFALSLFCFSTNQSAVLCLNISFNSSCSILFFTYFLVCREAIFFLSDNSELPDREGHLFPCIKCICLLSLLIYLLYFLSRTFGLHISVSSQQTEAVDGDVPPCPYSKLIYTLLSFLLFLEVLSLASPNLVAKDPRLCSVTFSEDSCFRSSEEVYSSVPSRQTSSSTITCYRGLSTLTKRKYWYERFYGDLDTGSEEEVSSDDLVESEEERCDESGSGSDF